MEFKCSSYLSDEMMIRLNEIKTFDCDLITKEALARKKPGFPHRELIIAAADHNARMINEYKGNPIGLSNRREYLARLVRMLQSDQVDGVEAAPDVMEDLIILNYLWKQAGKKAFLQNKMLIGTVNRGGLKGTVWELDDMRTCFTVSRIAALRMDGVKFMLRVNPMEADSQKTVEYCAQTITEAAEYGLPVFIEVIYLTTENGRYVMKMDSESLCKVVGVAGALGCTGANKWLEVPVNQEYAIPVGATTGTVLVCPDEREDESFEVIKEYTEQIGTAYNVRGILLGRNVMFSEDDPFVLTEAIADVWHNNVSCEEAYSNARAKADAEQSL